MSRPKGSKNKKTTRRKTEENIQKFPPTSAPAVKRGRGRPKGSKNKPKASEVATSPMVQAALKKRGRPKGSKNLDRKQYADVGLGAAKAESTPAPSGGVAVPDLVEYIRVAGHNDFYRRHRGPFKFSVTRTIPRKPGFASEALSGAMDAEDVESEALALLTDPRDTITHVAVWSMKEEQFVTVFR